VAAGGGALLAPHDADRPAVRLGRTPCGIEVAAHRLSRTRARCSRWGRSSSTTSLDRRRPKDARARCRPGGRSSPFTGAASIRCPATAAIRGGQRRARWEPGPTRPRAPRRGFSRRPWGCTFSRARRGARRRHRGDLFDDHARAAGAYAEAHAVTLDAPLDAVVSVRAVHRPIATSSRRTRRSRQSLRSCARAALSSRGAVPRRYRQPRGRGRARARRPRRDRGGAAARLPRRSAHRPRVADQDQPTARSRAHRTAGRHARRRGHAPDRIPRRSGTDVRGGAADRDRPRGGALLYRLRGARP